MKLLALLLAITLAGCASTGDYAAYANGQAAIEAARHSADAARYKAMSDIAATGDSSAKVAAVMALALGQGGAQGQATRIQAPKSDADIALSWAQILVPGLTSITGIVYGARVATTASDNAALVSQSTNNAFLGMAGKIQAPAPAAIPPANIYNTTTDRHDSIVATDSHDTATVLSGTGTIGSGDYRTSYRASTSLITPAPVVVPPVVPIVPVVVTNPPAQ